MFRYAQVNSSPSVFNLETKTLTPNASIYVEKSSGGARTAAASKSQGAEIRVEISMKI
jgi:hypothetical protein